MGKIKAEDFKIANRIDMGSKGKFNANADMEPQLAEKLNDMKNGDKEYNRLVRRGAITLITPDDEPEVQESSEDDDDESEPKSEEESADEEQESTDETEDDDDELTFEATGEYFAEHYGGGNYYIVEPNGVLLETVKGGKDKADARVEELNDNIEE